MPVRWWTEATASWTEVLSTGTEREPPVALVPSVGPQVACRGRGGVVRGAGGRRAESPLPQNCPPPGRSLGRRVSAVQRRQVVFRADRHRAAARGPTDRRAGRREPCRSCRDGCRGPLTVLPSGWIPLGREIGSLLRCRRNLSPSTKASLAVPFVVSAVVRWWLRVTDRSRVPRRATRDSQGVSERWEPFSPEKVVCTPADEFDADGEPDEQPATPAPVAAATTSKGPYLHSGTRVVITATIGGTTPARRDVEANFPANWRMVLRSAAEDPEDPEDGLFEFSEPGKLRALGAGVEVGLEYVREGR